MFWLRPASAQDAATAQQRLTLMGIVPTPERWVQFAAQGDGTVVDLLLQSGMGANDHESTRQVTALHNAAAQGHLRILKLLIERGADVNVTDWHGNTPLINAAYFGHMDVVKALLEKGANVNTISKEGTTALIAAIYSGKEPLINYLLSFGADPSLPEEVANMPLVVAQRARRDIIATQIKHRLVGK